MLDVVVGVSDQARDEDLVVGQLDVLPDPVLVHVARVGDLERVGAGVDAQHVRHRVAQGDVGETRAVVEAVAGVVTHAIGRDVAQRVVHGVDVGVGGLVALLDRAGRIRQGVDQPRVVDLQHEAGVDDAEVLLAHRLGDGAEVFLVAVVVRVATEPARARRRHEHLGDVEALDGCLEVGDVLLQQLVTDVGDRALADDPAQRCDR